MRRLRFGLNGLLNWIRSARLEREMRDEMGFHLDSRTKDLMREGLSERDARRRAQLEFGSVESYKEQTRDARGPRVLEDLIRDIGYALRGLRRSPALVLTCVFSLGTGIGVNATIFTAAPLRVMLHQPNRLRSRARRRRRTGQTATRCPNPNYRDLRRQWASSTDVIAYRIIRVKM